MLRYKRGKFSNEQIHQNCENLAKQIFSCLFKREKEETDLDYFISFLSSRVSGLSSILGYPPEIITILSLLESAQSEKSFKLFRKEILDACALMYKISEQFITVNNE